MEKYQVVSKLYYKPIEVAAILGELSSTLNYWEENKFIDKPKKNNPRKYTKDELHKIIVFYYLHKKVGLTSKQARNVVRYLNILTKFLNIG